VDADKAISRVISNERSVRQSYREYRYLQDLSTSDLRQICRDTFRNFITINVLGKAAPLSLNHPRHWYWRVRLLHVLEEFSVRFGPYPNGFDDEFVRDFRFPKPGSPRIRRAASEPSHRSLTRGKYLVKYGKKEHILDMLDHGLVRLAPASSYASAENNDAIFDTELKFTYSLCNPSPELVALHGALPSDLKADEPFHGTVFLEQTLREDYYLFCLSASYDPRLFDDFESDACLIIKAPTEFRDRLMRRAADQLQSKGWAFAPVTYVDPFSLPDTAHHPSLRKHHRYAYQDEVRAVWQMHKGCGMNLDACFVDLGSLRDISYVVCVDSA
jgi:hypothetical protein